MTIDISYKRIALLTYPVAITQMCETLIGVFDTMMVGRLGVTELAAIGLAGMVTFWFYVVPLGMFPGMNAMVAQSYGAGDERACGVVTWQGAVLALATGVVFAAMWFVVPGIFRLTGATPEVQTIATEYMRIRMVGAGGFLLLLLASNFYRGIGRTLIPMWFAIAQVGLNIVLNYGLIYGRLGLPALGTAGAALGSVIAQWVVGAALCASLFLAPALRTRYHLWSARGFDRAVFARLFHISWPTGVQTFVDMGAIIVFAALISRLGDAQLAATNAAIQAWSLSLMPIVGFSVGATTLVGQCIGAGQMDDARQVVWRLLRLAFGLNVLFAAVYLLAPLGFMGLFLQAEDMALVAPYARPLLTIVVVCMVFESLYNVGWGALRGAGDTRFPMVLNITVAWFVFAPLVIVVTPRFGLIGAWSCLIVFCAVIAVGITLRVRGDRWMRAAAVRPPVPSGASGDLGALGAGQVPVPVE